MADMYDELGNFLGDYDVVDEDDEEYDEEYDETADLRRQIMQEAFRAGWLSAHDQGRRGGYQQPEADEKLFDPDNPEDLEEFTHAIDLVERQSGRKLTEAELDRAVTRFTEGNEWPSAKGILTHDLSSTADREEYMTQRLTDERQAAEAEKAETEALRSAPTESEGD